MSEDGTHEITIRVPAAMVDLIRKAMHALGDTHNSEPQGEALLLALIDRGARVVIERNGGRAPDAFGRPLAQVSLHELADTLGILDLDATKRAARAVRETQEATLAKLTTLFEDLTGLCSIESAKRRIESSKDAAAFLAEVTERFDRDGGSHACIVALAWIHTKADGSRSYTGHASRDVH